MRQTLLLYFISFLQLFKSYPRCRTHIQSVDSDWCIVFYHVPTPYFIFLFPQCTLRTSQSPCYQKQCCDEHVWICFLRDLRRQPWMLTRDTGVHRYGYTILTKFCLITLQSPCISLHPHQWCACVPGSPDLCECLALSNFLTFASLVSVNVHCCVNSCLPLLMSLSSSSYTHEPSWFLLLWIAYLYTLSNFPLGSLSFS